MVSMDHRMLLSIFNVACDSTIQESTPGADRAPGRGRVGEGLTRRLLWHGLLTMTHGSPKVCQSLGGLRSVPCRGPEAAVQQAPPRPYFGSHLITTPVPGPNCRTR